MVWCPLGTFGGGLRRGWLHGIPSVRRIHCRLQTSEPSYRNQAIKRFHRCAPLSATHPRSSMSKLEVFWTKQISVTKKIADYKNPGSCTWAQKRDGNHENGNVTMNRLFPTANPIVLDICRMRCQGQSFWEEQRCIYALWNPQSRGPSRVPPRRNRTTAQRALGAQGDSSEAAACVLFGLVWHPQ